MKLLLVLTMGRAVVSRPGAKRRYRSRPTRSRRARHQSMHAGRQVRRPSGRQDSNLRPLVPQTCRPVPIRVEFDLGWSCGELVGMTTRPWLLESVGIAPISVSVFTESIALLPRRHAIERSHTKWETDEEARLLAEYDLSAPIDEIANAHGRSAMAIRSRLSNSVESPRTQQGKPLVPRSQRGTRSDDPPMDGTLAAGSSDRCLPDRVATA